MSCLHKASLVLFSTSGCSSRPLTRSGWRIVDFLHSPCLADPFAKFEGGLKAVHIQAQELKQLRQGLTGLLSLGKTGFDDAHR
jgi:hypothetical protein